MKAYKLPTTTMKRYLLQLSLWLPLVLLAACGGASPEGQDVGALKTLLATKKQELAKLSSEVKTLEDKIKKIDPQAAAQAKVKEVTAEPASTGTLKHYLRLQGAIESNQNINVQAKMPGVLTRVLVSEGDEVRAGQVLAETDNEAMKAQVAELKTRLELAVTVYEKQKTLWDQKIGSEIQFLQAKNNKEALEATLKSAQASLANSRVTAPVSGTIDLLYVKQGEAVGGGMPLCRIVNTSSVKAVAKVAESYLGTVKEGASVRLELPDLKKTIEARVTFVSKVVDPTTRTFTVEAKLPSEGAGLRPNMVAVFAINDVTAEKSVVIDQNLVQNTAAGQVVYVVREEGGKKLAAQRKVQTGLAYDGKVVIAQGINEGDLLVTSGYQDLVEGTPISFPTQAAR